MPDYILTPDKIVFNIFLITNNLFDTFYKQCDKDASYFEIIPPNGYISCAFVWAHIIEGYNYWYTQSAKWNWFLNNNPLKYFSEIIKAYKLNN